VALGSRAGLVPSSETRVGGFPGPVAIADIDGDGQPEIIGPLGRSVLVLSGTARRPVTRRRVIFVNRRLSGLASGDLNGDGRVDLVGVDVDTGEVVVLLGNARGELDPMTTLQGVRCCGHNFDAGIAVTDVTGDGHPDVVVNWGPGGVVTFPGDGAGGLGPQVAPGVSATANGYGLALADIDRDGNLDALVTGGRNSLLALAGDGTGRFRVAARYVLRGTLAAGRFGATPLATRIADLNRDGRPDLIASLGGTDAIVSFVQRPSRPVVSALATRPVCLLAGSRVPVGICRRRAASGIFSFLLSARARVRLVVRRTDGHVLSALSVSGPPGDNRVRLAMLFGRRPLPTGRYDISARPLNGVGQGRAAVLRVLVP